MTSPTEQAPAAGVETVARYAESWAVWGGEFRGMLQHPAGEWVKQTDAAAAIDALRATIADLEARLRTARADAWCEGRDAAAAAVAPWLSASHILLHAGEMTAQELRSVKAVVKACDSAIRALNPPEKPHDAS